MKQREQIMNNERDKKEQMFIRTSKRNKEWVIPR